jgi:hypothetical protein
MHDESPCSGAAGSIDQFVAQRLLEDEESAHKLIPTDIIEPPLPSNAESSNELQCIKGDLYTEFSSVGTEDVDVAYVFHGVMSLGAKADFDLGLKANFEATRALLETWRRTCHGATVIYASGQAVYNNPITLPVTESQMKALRR